MKQTIEQFIPAEKNAWFKIQEPWINDLEGYDILPYGECVAQVTPIRRICNPSVDELLFFHLIREQSKEDFQIAYLSKPQVLNHCGYQSFNFSKIVGRNASSLEKANHFLPRSFKEAPTW